MTTIQPQPQPQDQSVSALELFLHQQPSKSRVLLKVVHENGKKNLVAVQESKLSFLQRLSLLLRPSDYKLQEIVKYLESEQFQIPQEPSHQCLVQKALTVLDDKIAKHDAKFITRLFNTSVQRKHDSFDTMLKIKVRNDVQKTLLHSWFSSPTRDPQTLHQIISKLAPVKHDPLFEKLYNIALNLLEKPQEVQQTSTTIPTDVTAALSTPTAPKYGIYNPSTSCYLNATLQALRVCPAFRAFLSAQPTNNAIENLQVLLDSVEAYEKNYAECLNKSLILSVDETALTTVEKGPMGSITLSYDKKIGLLTHLIQTIFNRLEGNEEVTAGHVDRKTIQALRALIINLGFGRFETDLNSQEDAAEVCAFILEKLKVPTFGYIIAAEYDKSKVANVRVAALEPQAGHTARSLELGIQKGERSSLSTLVSARQIVHTIERDSLLMQDGLTPSEIERVAELPKNTQVHANESITFISENDVPNWLPIQLKRYDYSDGSQKKITDAVIEPSQTLEFAIATTPKKIAHYRLQAVAVHQGATPRSGHYYTFIPHEGGWIEYNDQQVKTHTYSEPLENIKKNGYLYTYKLEKISTLVHNVTPI